MVHFTPPMNTTVGSIQVFQCSLSLVNQTADVDAQSQKVTALHPELNKTTSTWHPVPVGETDVPTGNTLMDNVSLCHGGSRFTDSFQWGLCYYSMPPSDFPLNPNGDSFISAADLYAQYINPVPSVNISARYLIQKFNLHSANRSCVPSAVTLHDLENALSQLVATMFWICTFRPPLAAIVDSHVPYSDSRSHSPDTSTNRQ